MSPSDAQTGWVFLDTDRQKSYWDPNMATLPARVGVKLMLPKGVGVGDRLYGSSVFFCTAGFSSHTTPLHALAHSHGPVACKARLSGRVTDAYTKTYRLAEEFTPLAIADATVPINRFMLWCATKALPLTGEHEAVCRTAVETTRRWWAREASDADLEAARDAVQIVSNRELAGVMKLGREGKCTPPGPWQRANAIFTAGYLACSCNTSNVPRQRSACHAAFSAADCARLSGAVTEEEQDKKLTELLSALPGFRDV